MVGAPLGTSKLIMHYDFWPPGSVWMIKKRKLLSYDHFVKELNWVMKKEGICGDAGFLLKFFDI
jgi:hypothetical protein